MAFRVRRRLPRRIAGAVPARGRLLIAVAVAALAVVAGIFATRPRPTPRPKAPEPAPPTADTAAALDTVSFSQLRPRLGDHMAPPRIGLRWRFAPADSSTREVTFRVHLRGRDGALEITRQTQESHLNVDLGPNYPLGDCEWWVEALRPGLPAVRSRPELFSLQP